MAQRIDVQYIQFYTGGSAAPNVTPVAPVREQPLPRIKKQKVYRIYVDPVATLGIMVAFAMLIMMTVGAFRLRQIQRENTALQTYVTALQQENQDLQQRYADGYNLAEIQKKALDMGMIPKEEASVTPIEVQLPQPMEEKTLWQRTCTFIAELFA